MQQNGGYAAEDAKGNASGPRCNHGGGDRLEYDDDEDNKSEEDESDDKLVESDGNSKYR